MVGGYGKDGGGYCRRNGEGEPESSKILAFQNFQHTYLAFGKVCPVPMESLLLSQLLEHFHF